MKNTIQKTANKNEIVVICDEKDRNYWANRLGITAEVLKSTIRATGYIAFDQINEYLIKKKHNNYA